METRLTTISCAAIGLLLASTASAQNQRLVNNQQQPNSDYRQMKTASLQKPRILRFEQFEPRQLLSRDGLLGTYFDNADLTAEVQQRIDPIIQFPAGFNGASPDIGSAPAGTMLQPDDNWSIRWTGLVLIETAGNWTFHTDSDDGVRLWVNEQQVINNWTTHALQRDSGTLALPQGWLPIQLEYNQVVGKAAIQLSFEGPNQSEVVIPQSHLTSRALTGQDIGNVNGNFPGSTVIDYSENEFTLRASGADIQGTADAFHFAHTGLKGDGSIVARVNSIVNTNQFAKGGVMFRESLAPGSRNVMMEMKATTGSEFQYRQFDSNGTTVGERVFSVATPYWVRLERVGNVFTGYTSADGQTWQLQDMATVIMSETVFVGLAATAHNNNAITTVEFDNVSISGEIITPATPAVGTSGITGFIPLLTSENFDPLTDDGKDPAGFFADNDEFYTFRGDRFDVNAAANGPGHDEDEGKSPLDDDVVFRLTQEGYLHILGIPDDGQNQPFGYISTEDNYRNYHLSLEYKWGIEKFAPRQNAKRDSGLLYHAVGPDLVWTTNVETQIQEGDTGDFFFLGENVPGALNSSEGTVTVATGTNRYQPGGQAIDTGSGITKSQTVDSLTEWNAVEVIVEGDNVTVLVNGVVVNRATNLRRPDGSLFIPLTEGKIQLQAEGAEIFYRNIQIKPTHAVGGQGEFKLLVFQESNGSNPIDPVLVEKARVAIETLGEAQNFTVDVANDSAGLFTDANLSQYSAVIWNGTSGDVLSDNEQAAFQRYIESGGGFVGLQSAADTEHNWSWYGNLVGAVAAGTSTEQVATVNVDTEAAVRAGGSGLLHPAADSVPEAWTRRDVWYNYSTNPRANTNVLLTVDESTYNEGADPISSSDHPISWWHDFGGGRSFYSGLGLTEQTYVEPLYLQHLLGGIEYAAGVSRVAPEGAIVLFDGTDRDAFEKVNGGGDIDWQLDDENNLMIIPGTGNIQTKQGFTDYQLHLEFKIPATPPGTSEQRRGNSGLYLHSSYELQLLDSYRDPNFDAQHLGSIYNFKVADANAALPAETWQTYDVQFTAPKFDPTTSAKLSNARITAYLNGVLIHDDVEVTTVTNGGQPEQAGPRPFFLQDHDPNSKLRFRNIWLLPRTAEPGDFNDDGTVDNADLEQWQSDYGLSADSDADQDGDTDGNDFLIWQRNRDFASAAQAAAAASPSDPSTIFVQEATERVLEEPLADQTQSNDGFSSYVGLMRFSLDLSSTLSEAQEKEAIFSPQSASEHDIDSPTQNDHHHILFSVVPDDAIDLGELALKEPESAARSEAFEGWTGFLSDLYLPVK